MNMPHNIPCSLVDREPPDDCVRLLLFVKEVNDERNDSTRHSIDHKRGWSYFYKTRILQYPFMASFVPIVL